MRWCSTSAAIIFAGWPDAATLAAFLVSLVLAFLLGFFLEAAIGMIGFWFLEVSSLLFVYMLFSFFFSGQMFPIDMLPGVWTADRATDCRCSTWRISRRRSSWARSRGTDLVVGLWRAGRLGACSSSIASRVALSGMRRYSAFELARYGG